jgi:hypothetical protein
MLSQQDRVNVRHFLGYAAIFKQEDPRLEGAMTAIQSVSDGGSQPDSSSENALRSMVADALTVECSLKSLWTQMQVGKAGTTIIDALRGMGGLRMEGRRIVNGISAILSTWPRRDIFSGATVNADGDSFYQPGTAAGGSSDAAR